MYLNIFTILSFAFICFTSCASKNAKENTYIESPYITISDTSIIQCNQQALYDKLFEIYAIQKDAIVEKIRQNVFFINPKDAYLPIDTIIDKYNIKIKLKEPTPPTIQISPTHIVWNGKKDAPNNIIMIFDPDCDLCKITSLKLKEFHKGKENNIKIGYVIYSIDYSFAEKALMYSIEKNKFNELHNYFMQTTKLDSISIIQGIEYYFCDSDIFIKNSNSLTEQLSINNTYLQQLGIYRLPTIIINNRLTYNPLDTTLFNKIINTADQ